MNRYKARISLGISFLVVMLGSYVFIFGDLEDYGNVSIDEDKKVKKEGGSVETKKTVDNKFELSPNYLVEKYDNSHGDIPNYHDFEYYENLGAGQDSNPGSFFGTEVDGLLRTDDQGHLIVEHDNRLLFDYFLAGLGEENLETIKGRVAYYIEKSVSGVAIQESWKMFENYLQYKYAISSVASHDGSQESMMNAVKNNIQLQQSWLGIEVASAFYGFDNAYDRYTLGEIAANDNTLSKSDREKKMALLEHTIPKELLDAMGMSRKPIEVSDQVRDMRISGSDESEVYQVRADAFGADAADRLLVLDQQRGKWDRRYQEYKNRWEEVLELNMSESEELREITFLRNELFNGSEMKRVEALDRIQNRTLSIINE